MQSRSWICRQCLLDQWTASSCTNEAWHHGAKRIPFGSEQGSPAVKGDRCHDCNCEFGGYHHLYCDLEECPICRGQALFCEHSSLPGTPGAVKARGANLSPALGIYYLSDVCRLTGAKRSQVENWVRSGWLAPEARASTGTGDRRLFSFPNLVDVSIGERLSRFHIPLRTLFKDISAKTLRDLVPDQSAFDGMSDRQIIAFHTQGWRAKNWRDVLEGGITKQAYITDAIERYRNHARRWHEFINPRTRPAEAYRAVGIHSNGHKYSVCWQTEYAPEVYDAAVVINLSMIFAELEDATGDQWGNPDERREVETSG